MIKSSIISDKKANAGELNNRELDNPRIVPAENPLPDTNVSNLERPAIVYQPVSSIRKREPAPVTRRHLEPPARKYQPGPSVARQLASLLFNIRTLELFLDCFIVVVIPAIFLVNAAILVEHYQLEILEIIEYFTAERPVTYLDEIVPDEVILRREAKLAELNSRFFSYEWFCDFIKHEIRYYKNRPSQPVVEPFIKGVKRIIGFIEVLISCYQK